MIYEKCPSIKLQAATDEISKLKHDISSMAQEQSEVASPYPELFLNDNRKRKRAVNTPAKRKHVLVEHLQALFHFISGVDSVNGWFSVKSAIMNGFLKEHQDSDLSTKEKANEFAKNKLKTIRKYHEKNDCILKFYLL